jgi:hypothetical protein
MQPSTLIGNLNSSFLEKMGGLRPKNSPKTIYVYVESHEDKAFGVVFSMIIQARQLNLIFNYHHKLT